MKKLLFFFVLIFVCFVFGGNCETIANVSKTVKEVFSNVSTKIDCKIHCLKTANCTSFELKNRKCFLTISENAAILKPINNTNYNLFKFRSKRKQDKDDETPGTTETKIAISKNNAFLPSYKYRYRFKTWKDWAILVVAFILAFIWMCFKGTKKSNNPSSSSPINNNLTTSTTMDSVDKNNDINPAVTISSAIPKLQSNNDFAKTEQVLNEQC